MIKTSYAMTQGPTPVFNTPDFASYFEEESGDDIRSKKYVETVLFPGSKIELLEQVAQSNIWKIKTDEYMSDKDLFIDDRFVATDCESFSERKSEIPSIPEILKTMEELQKNPYVWGGNWPQGIPLLSELYPSKTEFSELKAEVQASRKLAGVDCSGLLYYATQGNTPRNSSDLVNFGNPVNIENKDANAILKELQDLDLIVWNGHVVVVYSAEETIESIDSDELKIKGVVKFNSRQRLQYVMKTRVPVNTPDSTDKPHFVVRRWHPDNK